MENTFKNPILSGADPFVLMHNDMYYLYCTTENDKKLEDHRSFDTSIDGEDGIKVYRSEDLKTWSDMGYCLKKEDVMGEKWFWAPEVYCYKNKFYMVYSAEEHIAIAVAENPLGPFVQKEKKWLREANSIDGHLFFDDDGSVYLYYVRFNNGNKIYVAKMAEDLMSIEKEYEECIIAAEDEWETIDCAVAEGPFVLKHNGIYYITYSANHTRCKDYAVGYAISKSPFGPFEKYEKNPILRGRGKFVGTGHHSFFKLKDGKTMLCAYHCHNDNPDNFKPRKFCLSTAEFVQTDSGADELVIYAP